MDWDMKSFVSEFKYAWSRWWPLFCIVVAFAVWTEIVLPKQTIRKNTVCPSYLSIARSARDTLIVMRNDKECATYVLEHL